MASEETKNGDNIPTSCSPLQRNEDVESDNTQNELEMNNFSRVDGITGHGADNVQNPRLQPLPSGVQDTGQQFPANRISGAQTAEGHQFPQRIGFQIAGQEIAVARGTAQAFNVPTRPSQRRYVRPQSSVVRPSYIAHPALSTRPVQRSTIPHTYQFMPESIQAVPSPTRPTQRSTIPHTYQFMPESIQAVPSPTRPIQHSTIPHTYQFMPESIQAVPSPTRPIQRSTIPHTYQFMPESIQAVPSPAPLLQTAPFPPEAQTAASSCPSSQTAATLQTAPFSPQAQTAAFHYSSSQTTAPVQTAPFPTQAQMAAFHHPLYQPAAPVQRAPFPPQAQTAAFPYPISRTAAPTQTARPPSPLANEFIPLHSSQGNSGQSQTSVPIRSFIRLITPAYSTVTSVERGSGPIQASNAPVQPSHKRSASQSSPVGRAVKHRNLSIIPESGKASVRPQAQTATALSPSPQTTARSFTSLNARAQAAVDQPADHILPDVNRLPEPSGRQCFLCKRDLSFTPAIDGPISQPIVPPSVAVFSCGHYFHARCAETVTPVDRSTDPPCIRCIMERS